MSAKKCRDEVVMLAPVGTELLEDIHSGNSGYNSSEEDILEEYQEYLRQEQELEPY